MHKVRERERERELEREREREGERERDRNIYVEIDAHIDSERGRGAQYALQRKKIVDTRNEQKNVPGFLCLGRSSPFW